MPAAVPPDTLDTFATFGDLLRYLRRRAGLTQTELAVAVGYSHAQISRLEHNHRLPDLATITARFVPALGLEGEPALVARLLELAGSVAPPPVVDPEHGRTRHNLPLQLTSFIGREQEIAQVKQLLSAARLVTLTGAGGSGKTRLALRVGSEAQTAYPDGVWLVDLAPLSNADLVPHKMAAALGVSEQPNRALLTTLTEYFRSRHVLLILDNCEHLVAACALLAEALLGACPSLTILATSREGLGIAGEALYLLPTLACPDPRQLSTSPADGPAIDLLRQYDAVRLFVERARAVARTFHLTAQNARAVAQVCQRLDGIPLAIELAAARVKVLSLGEIADRLDDRFNLLTTGRRTALPRHQTLRGLIDWSHDLLAEHERAMLRRLAAFAGGFTLKAATAVCAGDGIPAQEVLDLLSHLVDKSLVLVEPGPSKGQPRYRLLETIRHYARDRLSAAQEAAAVQRRHAQYYLSLAEEAEPGLKTRERGVWMDRLEAEHDNLRAALAWSAANDDGTLARLAWALVSFWLQGGYVSEGRGWLAGALTRNADDEPTVRARLLGAAGQLARQHYDTLRAAVWLEESARLWRVAGCAGEAGLAYTLVHQAHVTRALGDPAAGRTLAEEAVALFRAQADRWGLALALAHLALAIRDQEDFALARVTIDESVALWQALGDTWGLHTAQVFAGMVARRQGDYEAAYFRFCEALALAKATGDREGVAESLYEMGTVMLNLGQETRAKAYFEESLIRYRELGAQFSTTDGLLYLGYLALYDGDDTLAQSHLRQALEMAREVGPSWFRGDCLKGIAGLAAVRGHAVSAARLWGAAEAQIAAGASYMDNGDCIFFGRIISAAQAKLGAAAFEAARAEGRAMSAEQAMEYGFAALTDG